MFFNAVIRFGMKVLCPNYMYVNLFNLTSVLMWEQVLITLVTLEMKIDREAER